MTQMYKNGEGLYNPMHKSGGFVGTTGVTYKDRCTTVSVPQGPGFMVAFEVPYFKMKRAVKSIDRDKLGWSGHMRVAFRDYAKDNGMDIPGDRELGKWLNGMLKSTGKRRDELCQEVIDAHLSRQGYTP